jgi:peroxiredoxin
MQRVLLAFSLVAYAGGCAASSAPSAESPASSTRAGSAPASASRLPDFRLTTIDGERFALSDHVGEDVIVISFWATWCMPCLAELPHLSDLYEREKDNGLVVVAVSMDEPNTQAQVAPTARRLGLEMPVVIDDEQRAVRLYNKGRDAPMTVVIDRQGQIVRAQAGYSPGDEARLEAQVRALLAQS